MNRRTDTTGSMNRTGIEWTDYTWNPVTGCLHGCPYCYARKLTERRGLSFEPQLHENRLGQPFKVKAASRIFVCSMADLFGPWVPDLWIKRVIEVVTFNPHHEFQMLTKNPERYLDFKWPGNTWLGASATNQRQWDRAAGVLPHLKSRTFISAEPLLEPIYARPGVHIDWLIIGAQTGPEIQPDPQWVDRLVSFADVRRIPVFMKKNLKHSNPRKEMPA